MPLDQSRDRSEKREKYSAFISYSSADRRVAIALHRSLEAYHIPKRLQGREGPAGTIGRRLPPVFRDRDELPASSDLGQALRNALDDSAFLVVVCSPASAASRWVGEEIAYFLALGRGDRILCLIADGEPHAANPGNECLPAALLASGIEPLAADARPGHDGPRAARLKVIASILGVSYDDLRQRETQRQIRRLAWTASASTIGLIIMAALATMIFLSRREAVRERNIALQRTRVAERTVDFVKSMFKVSDPETALGKSLTARELIDRGSGALRRELKTEPTTRATLAITLAEVYNSLGLFQNAEAMLNWSATLRTSDEHVAKQRLLALGEVRRNLGNNPAAIDAYRGVLTIHSMRDEDAMADVRALIGLGQAQGATGDFTTADRTITLALDKVRADRKDDLQDLALAYEAKGQNHYAADQLAAAEVAMRMALQIRMKIEDPLSPGISDDYVTLGDIAYQRGDLLTAERLIRSRLGIDERVLGPEHADVATTLNNLARVELEQRKFTDALALLERAVAIEIPQRGWTHPDMAFFLANRAIAKRELGQLKSAATDFELALKAARLNSHRNLGPILIDLAYTRCLQGERDEGKMLVTEADTFLKKDYPDQLWRQGWRSAVEAFCLPRQASAKTDRLRQSASATLRSRWPMGTLYREIFESMLRGSQSQYR